jgi:Bacteriophage lambda head decoration protein D
MPDAFPFDPPPGFTKPTHSFGRDFGDEFHAPSDDELLAAYNAFTQRGVQLAGGQGVLPTGCVIARHTASSKYFVYNPGATDGRQVPLGILREWRDTGGIGYASLSAYNTASGLTLTGGSVNFPASPAGKTPADILGNMVIRGILNLGLVSGADTSNLITSGFFGAPPVYGPNGLGSGAGQIISTLMARIDAANGLFIF